jgi:hypothetical protein
MPSNVPEGYQVVIVEEEQRVRIYHLGREIVSARIEQLAAFYCWLSAERDALEAFKQSVDADLNSGDGAYRP